MNDTQCPIGSTDPRDYLDYMKVPWRDHELFERIHTLAEQSNRVLSQLIVLYSLVETPLEVDEQTRGLWETMLLRTAVEIKLFPDVLKKHATWDEYSLHVRPAVLSGSTIMSNAPGWDRSQTIMAAWNVTLAEMPSVVTIGPVSEDSAHHALLAAAVNLWEDRSSFVNDALEEPEKQAALWNEFIARWCTQDVAFQLRKARATLAVERARIRQLFEPPSRPAARASDPADERSTPMSKAELRTRTKLRRTAFETWARNHDIRLEPGSDQLWTISLSRLDKSMRKKIEG